MTFRGKREEGVDYMDDVLEQLGGIHGGAALDEFEGIKEQFQPDGLHVETSCKLCGKKHDVTMEWYELYIVGSNRPGVSPLLPEGWEYSDNNATAFVSMRCSKCSPGSINVHLTPDEARTAIQTAVSRGFIDPRAAASWKQRVEMARGQR